MNCSWSHVDLGFRFGDIGSMSKEAIEIAKLLDTKVSFVFNGVKVNVTKFSSYDTVAHAALDAVRDGKISAFGEGW